jgi:putative SOS response-associated peptidase YedK
MFRDAFRRSRCVILASGYYEWKPTPTGKQPYYISAANGSIPSFAGLWDEWHDPESDEQLKSCTIIVTDATALTRQFMTACRLFWTPIGWQDGSAARQARSC